MAALFPLRRLVRCLSESVPQGVGTAASVVPGGCAYGKQARFKGVRHAVFALSRSSARGRVVSCVRDGAEGIPGIAGGPGGRQKGRRGTCCGKSWTDGVDKAAGFTRVALVFLGFALIRRWLSLVTFLVPAHVAATLPLSMSTLFALVQCATSVAVVVASHRLAPLHRRGPFLGGSVALLSGGTLLAAFSGSFFQPALACMAGVGLAAAGYSVLFVLWLRALCVPRSREGRRRLRRFVRGVQRPLVGAGRRLDEPVLVAVSGLLPVVSLLMLVSGFRRIPRNHLPSDRQCVSLSSSWRFVFWIAAFSFVYGVAESIALPGFGSSAYVGRLFPNIVVLVGTMFFVRRFDLATIYRMALPLMLVGFVSAIVAGDPYVTQFFVTAGYECYLALAYIFACSIACRLRASSASLCALILAVHSSMMLVGKACSGLALPLAQAPDQQAIVFGVLGLALAATSAFVFREKDFYRQWNISGFSPQANEDERAARKTVGKAAARFGLNPREEHIAVLVMEGKSNAEIASELFIAPGTVRAHTSRIYGKFDVHSREELMARLQSLGLPG